MMVVWLSLTCRKRAVEVKKLSFLKALNASRMELMTAATVSNRKSEQKISASTARSMTGQIRPTTLPIVESTPMMAPSNPPTVQS